MAVGAQRVLEADWGVATTGVAGPEPQDGMPVGCVFVAVAEPGGSVVVERHDLAGGRPEIRAAAVDAALALLAARLGPALTPPWRRPVADSAAGRQANRSSKDRNGRKLASRRMAGGADASRGRMSHGSDVVLTEMPHQTTSPPLRRPRRRFAFGGTSPWRLATTGYGGDHSTGRTDTAEEGFHGPVAT